MKPSVAIFFFILAALVSIYLFIKPFGYLKPDINDTSFIYGVTFSPQIAQHLSGDFKKVYLSILDELNAKNVRIPTYWNILEPNMNSFDFSQVDFMVSEASKKQAKILMVLGIKQPRWPECHIPDWARSLTISGRQEKALRLMEKIIKRYKDSSAVWAWQVENEPMLRFGAGCDPIDIQFLKKEIALVKKLDPKKPVIITDSGEWQTWFLPAALSDILGISVYKKAYTPFLGYITFPVPSAIYKAKASLVKKLTGKENQKVIIAELQSEPWLQGSFKDTPEDVQLKTFTLEDFKGNLVSAQKTNFREIYFWGAEWWYFMKEKGHPEYWDFAKNIFKI